MLVSHSKPTNHGAANIAPPSSLTPELANLSRDLASALAAYRKERDDISTRALRLAGKDLYEALLRHQATLAR